MMRNSTMKRTDPTYVRPSVYFEDQIVPSRINWVTEHTVQHYDNDDLRDWITATRRRLGIPTMALVIAEGLKAMNFAQLPVTTSEQGRPSHSRGKTDGYARKSRERSNFEVPNVMRTSGNGRSEKFGGSTQEGYEQESYSQQIPNVKVNDAYSYGESHIARVPNDAHPYGGIHNSTGRFSGAKSNENYPYSEMHDKSVGASSAKPGENYQYGGKHGSTWRPSKGHQSSGYPPAYQSYSNDSNDSERPDVPSYGQAIPFQQIPYAQQPYQYRDNQASVGRGPYYDGRSSSSSDSLRYSDSDRSF